MVRLGGGAGGEARGGWWSGRGRGVVVRPGGGAWW